MPRYLFAAACALALTACGSLDKDPPVEVPPIADPCPAEGTADLRPEPVNPVPPADRGPVYSAVASVLGPDRAQALIRFWETDHPTWGRQGWERVKRTKEWCDAR